MDYNKLPSNSFSQQSNQKQKPVAKGTLEPKSQKSKLLSAFVGSSMEDIKNHTIYDVLIPGIKKMIADTITNAVSWFFFGSPAKNSGWANGSSNSKVSYDGFWAKTNSSPKATSITGATNSNAQFNYADPGFETEAEAKEVRDNVSDCIDRKGCITVAQFYDLAGIDNYPHTMNQYGWRGMATIANSSIVQRSNGSETRWILKMPKISPLRQDEWQ